MDEALARFRAQGFDLLLAGVQVSSAEADEISAGAIPNPGVNASIGKTFSYDPRTCAGCSSIPWSAGISDEGALVNLLSGKRQLRLRVARAALEASRMSRLDAERTLELSVKQQYVAAALAQQSLAFAREAATSANQTFELVALRYRAGAVSEADSAKVETAKLEAEQAVDAAQQAASIAKATLAFMLGVRAVVTDFELDAMNLHGPAPERLDSVSREQLFHMALEHRPDLKAAAFQRDGAAAAIDLTRRQRFPDIALSAQYAQEGTGQNAIQPPTVTFGISTPLPIFYQNRGEIAKANASLAAQRIALSRTEAAIATDIEIALATYTSTRSRVIRMETQLLDRAKRTRDLVQVQYDKGAASLLELLDAQRTFMAANFEYLQNVSDHWTAVFALEEAVAMDLRK